MAKTTTWVTSCKICGCPVYYYPASLLLDFESVPKEMPASPKKVVDCTCNGETEKGKHTISYIFPAEFSEIK